MDATGRPRRRGGRSYAGLAWGGGAVVLLALVIGFAPALQQPQPDGPGPGFTTSSVHWGVVSSLQQVIERQEYYMRPDGYGGFKTPNRYQDLRFQFDALGFTLTPRGNDPEWSMRFELEGIGRPQQWQRPSPHPSMIAQGSELRVEHGPFAVRYANDRTGMRQDFLVHDRPAGDDPLQVRIRVSGPLVAMSAAPDAVHFVARDPGERTKGPAFTYDGLLAWDAQGDTLDARMTVNDTELVITVDDQDAVYPITIDPLSSTGAALLEMDQPGALFGTCTATAGDVNGDGYSDLLVGAPWFDMGTGDEGAAFLFLGSPTGLASSPAWTWSAGQPGARCGQAVATAGDVNGDGFSDILVGVPFWSNGQTDEGRAVLFLGASAGPSTVPSWSMEGQQVGARAGISLATAGDVNADGYSDVLVGADGYDNGQVDEGVVFVHMGSATGLGATASNVLQRDQAGAAFGAAVSGAGDVNRDGYSDIVIGAPLYDNTLTDEGGIFLYHGSSSGLPTDPTTSRFRPQVDARFGASVSFAGDVNGDGFGDVIVGAPQYSGTLAQQGQAMLYRGGLFGIAGTPSWTASGGQAGARAGTSVAGLGDANGDGFADVAVGLPAFSNGQSGEGLVRVFMGVSSLAGLVLTPSWSVEGQQVGAALGTWVAAAGDVNGDGLADLAVGAPSFDNGQTDEGRVFVFHGTASSPATAALWSIESDQANAQLGYCVSRAGDVNGDGFADVIIGARQFSNGQNYEGRATVHLGSATGPAAAPSWSMEGNQADANFGHVVASAGDVNGDGYGDVIIGAPYYDNGQVDEGRAYVFLGSPAGLSAAPAWTFESDRTGARLGWSVASAGDVNGDGYGDVIVGAYMYDATVAAEGRCFLFLGSATGLSTTPAWVRDGGQIYGFFGIAVALAGDVNGDGLDDVIVGADLYDNTFSTEGAAFLFLGTPTGLEAAPSWTTYGGQNSAQLGVSVGHAGDVNGDGYSDVFVTAYRGSNGQSAEGIVRVYHGSVTGLPALPTIVLESNQVDARFGVSASYAGDVNGDGYGDLVVGAQLFSTFYLNEGRASIYLGGPGGLTATAGWTFNGGQTGAESGFAVSGAGDVNGDGFGDIVVGAPNYANGQSYEGRASLFLGNGGSGIAQRTRQYREDMATPVQTGNKTFNSSCGWGIGQFARSPLGRTRLKLQWEVKGHGPPFSGAPITSGMGFTGASAGWTDSGIGGVDILEPLSVLALSSSHPAWRVRVRYHPATMLNGQPFGLWRYGGLHDDQVPSLKVDLDICGPLAVQWLDYWGGCVDGRPTLEWSVADVTEVRQFHIAASADGFLWYRMGSVPVSGGGAEHTWQEEAPMGATSYYRVEVELKDGRSEPASVLVVLSCDGHGDEGLTLMPNPASASTCVVYQGAPLEGHVIRVLSSNGQQVTRIGPFTASEGQRACINIDHMQAGLYLVVLENAFGVRSASSRLVVP